MEPPKIRTLVMIEYGQGLGELGKVKYSGRTEKRYDERGPPIGTIYCVVDLIQSWGSRFLHQGEYRALSDKEMNDRVGAENYLKNIHYEHPCLAITYSPYFSGETLLFNTIVGHTSLKTYITCDDRQTVGSPKALFIPNLESDKSIFIGEYGLYEDGLSKEFQSIKNDIKRNIDSGWVYPFDEKRDQPFNWGMYIDRIQDATELTKKELDKITKDE